MNDEQIIKAAVGKAQTTGWFKDTRLDSVGCYDGTRGFDYRLFFKTLDEDDLFDQWSRDAATIFFSHDFALAFFGDDTVGDSCGTNWMQHKHCDECCRPTEAWQYHLSKLAITSPDERLKYIERFF